MRSIESPKQVLIAAALLLTTGALAEYQFQVIEKTGEAFGAAGNSIELNSRPLRTAVADGFYAVGDSFHRAGDWARP